MRASTAAPHFFDPEIVQILADEEKTGRHRRGPEDRDWLDQLNDKLGRFPRLTMLLTKLRALPHRGHEGPQSRRRTGCSSMAA